MNLKSTNKLHFDWVLILLYFILISMGWFSIFASSGTEGFTDIFNFETLHGKQLLWIILNSVLIIVVISLESSFYERYSGVIYVVAILVLLGLFVLGKNINGQTNWYVFGGFSIQPSEFVKIATTLAVASIVGDNLFDISKFKDLRKVILVILVPTLIIIAQKDVGSAFVFLSFIFVLLKRGLSIWLFIVAGFIAFLFVLTIKIGVQWTLISVFSLIFIMTFYAIKKIPLFLIRNYPFLVGLVFSISLVVFGSNYAFEHVLQSHHKDRLNLWLRTEKNPEKIIALKRTFGYNNDQSIQSIASGGFTGKGFLEGDRTNGKFVPAQSTDYIFSVVGEEFGFTGSAFVILVFMALILRIIYKAEIQKSNFSKYYGYGVASILFAHFFVNIGMVLDLLPTVGIPLPFFSYGGSSLWAFTILIFIFIKLDAFRLDDF